MSRNAVRRAKTHLQARCAVRGILRTARTRNAPQGAEGGTLRTLPACGIIQTDFWKAEVASRPKKKETKQQKQFSPPSQCRRYSFAGATIAAVEFFMR